MDLRWRQRLRTLRWPIGMAMASWRWLRRSRAVRRRGLDSGDVSGVGERPPPEAERRQDASTGVGPAYHRRYRVRVTGGRLDARELIDVLCADLNAASPAEVAVFDKTRGAPGRLDVGDEYVVHMPGPWDGPVRVVERTPRSFRLVTLRGHMEAGEIDFRAADDGPTDVTFTIESWARSGDQLADVLYDTLRISKEMQLHMWTHFCERIPNLAGGTRSQDVEVATERAVKDDGRHPVVRIKAGWLTGRWRVPARVLADTFAATFALAAWVRGGRPLHPTGHVLDATLRLTGAPTRWETPFLDDAAELHGVARLSRSVGLPPRLPDLLGLALRWTPDADSAEERTAELLLATTGRGVLGRRMLLPTTTWTPAMYSTLLSYEAGGRRVVVGAVSEGEPRLTADGDALSRAVEACPLRLQLVVASVLGRWERFGELELAGPVRSDDEEPVRFDPDRHRIPGLRPAGLLQQSRGSAYAAAQRVRTRKRETSRHP